MAAQSTWATLRQAARQWSSDHASEMGAALAYYSVFSIAPLLVIVIAIAGLVFGGDAARGAVEAELSSTMNAQAAHYVQEVLRELNRPRVGILSTVVGCVTLLFGALGVFLQLRSALCRIWRLSPSSSATWLAMLIDYLLALSMVLCCVLLMLVLLTANAVLIYLGRTSIHWLPGGQGPWQGVEFLISFAIMTLLFAALFWVLSGRRIRWRWIWYGAGVTALLFTVGKSIIGFYLGLVAGSGSAYGAAGSLVVFLIWIYYSAQIVFFGAELVQVRRQQEGVRR
jgi:membrane protein